MAQHSAAQHVNQSVGQQSGSAHSKSQRSAGWLSSCKRGALTQQPGEDGPAPFLHQVRPAHQHSLHPTQPKRTTCRQPRSLGQSVPRIRLTGYGIEVRQCGQHLDSIAQVAQMPSCCHIPIRSLAVLSPSQQIVQHSQRTNMQLHSCRAACSRTPRHLAATTTNTAGACPRLLLVGALARAAATADMHLQTGKGLAPQYVLAASCP